MMHAKSRVNGVVAGLLLGILMASMDNTIVATAMGTIVADLGGLQHFIWVTSAYMIASVAGMPIFGKLSDMYGRKAFYITGLTLFILGSILCGFSQSMVELSISRAIQGLGGGALMPIAFTIIFDIFPPEKRGKMSALFGAVFGLSSVCGPLLGAFITDYFDWRWIFFINLPLGILSFFFIWRFYHESLERTRQKIDWLGAGLLVTSIVSLMFALELGGKEIAWNSPMIYGLFAAFAILLGFFLYVESRVPQPIISLKLFKIRLFAASQGIGFLYGSVFVVATVFIPLFVQAVFGGSATNSGLILMPMMLGVVAGSQTSGRLVMFASYRRIMMGSGALLLTGILLLGTLSVDTSRWFVTLFMVITGMGMGMSFPLLSMSSIEGLDIRQRGAANSAVAFFRMIGMTLGITIFGTIQNHLMMNDLGQVLTRIQGVDGEISPQALLQPEVRQHIPPQVLEQMSQAFADSIATVFQWSLIPISLAIVLIFLMGKRRLVVQKPASKEAVTKAPEPVGGEG
nr:MDR family MFS transporter [Marininema halotolerans]